jgi:Family of unknown function (DUF6055)
MPNRGRNRLLVVALAFALMACESGPTPAPGRTDAPTASPVASSPVAPSSGPAPTPGDANNPTSADLIQADLDAGKIDRPTSILYRIYAIFGDPRLPDAYRSTVAVEDGAALAAARIGLDTFPPAIASELRPYLVRPTDPSSVFHDIRAATASAGASLVSMRLPGRPGAPPAAPAAVVCNPVSGWGYALGLANFKVWGECGDPANDADIQQVVAMVDGFWDAESTFLGIEPLADEGAPDPDVWLNDGGGDPRIDIYLVNECVVRDGACHALGATSYGETGVTGPHTTVQGVGVWASYVLLPKSLLAQARLFRATVAHELFHVFQNSMNFDGPYNGSYHWIVEATAKWAEWHFSQVEDNVTPWFSGFQVVDQGLLSTANGNAYNSFTWPLFLEEETGGPDVVAAMWHAIEGKVGFRAVDDVIDQQYAFKDHFREFAIRNWNKELGIGDPMDPLHPLPPTSRQQPFGKHAWAETTLPPNEERGNAFVLAETLPPLYAKYAPFTVDPKVGQVILDLGGLSPKERFHADVLVKVKDQGWERRKLKQGTTTWCIDNPDDHIEQFVVIISSDDYTGYGVSGQWTVESLLEPCLSYAIHIDYTEVYDGIADAFKYDGFADKVDQDLSGNGVWTINGTGTMSGSRPGWRHCNPGIEVTPSGSGPAIFVASVSGETVSIGAFPDAASADWGISTEPFTMDRKGGTLTIKSGNAIGDLCPRSWYGTIKAEIKLKEPLGNEEGP